MNALKFSNVLGKVNNKYIIEAVTYKRKKKTSWMKWGAMAACLCLVAVLAAVSYTHLTLPTIVGV